MTASGLRPTLTRIFEIDNSPRRIVPMEGLRGLAVLLVFFVHYVTLIEPWVPNTGAAWSIATATRWAGNSGVDLFFVLSGFLIYGTLIGKRRPLLPYLRRRIERIYPAFMCLLAVYMLLSFVLPGESKFPPGFGPGTRYLLANILLLPGLTAIEPIITVAWSLSYEFFYYLIIPLIIGVLGLRAWPAQRRVILWVALAVCGFVYVWNFGGYVRLLMFVSGILLHDTLRSIPTRHADWLGLGGLVGALVLITVIAELGLSPPLRFVVLFAAFYALCYGSFAALGLTARLFSWTPLRWLGNMSYSYYLSHGLALKALFMALGLVVLPQGNHPWLLLSLLPVAVAATLVVSGTLFILIEKPLSLAPHRSRAPLPLPHSVPAP